MIIFVYTDDNVQDFEQNVNSIAGYTKEQAEAMQVINFVPQADAFHVPGTNMAGCSFVLSSTDEQFAPRFEKLIFPKIKVFCDMVRGCTLLPLTVVA